MAKINEFLNERNYFIAHTCIGRVAVSKETGDLEINIIGKDVGIASRNIDRFTLKNHSDSPVCRYSFDVKYKERQQGERISHLGVVPEEVADQARAWIADVNAFYGAEDR